MQEISVKINICGVLVDNASFATVLAAIERIASGDKPSYIITVNVDHLIKLQKDAEFRKIYDEAALVVPDGVPLLWAARFLGTPLKERINGTDLFEALCGLSAAKGLRLFFLGGRPAAAAKAAVILKEKFPLMQVCGIYSPPFGFEKNDTENEKIVRMVSDTKPHILFVGLGAPKQERWIYRHKDKLRVPVSIGIGVSFELIAGIVKRAPLWMQRVGLEWFWRLLMEPGRLWKRYLVEDMKFFWLVFKQKLSRAR